MRSGDSVAAEVLATDRLRPPNSGLGSIAWHRSGRRVLRRPSRSRRCWDGRARPQRGLRSNREQSPIPTLIAQANKLLSKIVFELGILGSKRVTFGQIAKRLQLLVNGVPPTNRLIVRMVLRPPHGVSRNIVVCRLGDFKLEHHCESGRERRRSDVAIRRSSWFAQLPCLRFRVELPHGLTAAETVRRGTSPL